MSNIQIQDVDQRVQYTATSLQTVFTVPFPFLANSDLVVYQNDTKLDLGASAGEYGVSGALNPSGGTVTLVTGATVNDIITIIGNQPIDRTSIYSATISNLTGSDLNNDFNREIIMLKQLWTTQNLLQLQYQPYAEVSQDENVTTDRWIPKLSANQVWAMNAAGTEIVATDFDNVADAPVDAQYFLATPDGQLPNGVDFGSLAAGLIKHSVTAGVSTPATAVSGTDYWAPGNTLDTPTLLVLDDIQHKGDTDNRIVFGTDTQDYQTGGSSRLDLSDSGVRLGGANSRVTTILDQDNMSSNSATALATQQSIKAYADLMLPLAGGTMSGNIDMGTNKVTNAAAPTLGSDYTTKNYVDNIVENTHVAADLASTANFSYTYDNGSSGVGATLTAGGNGVVTMDGESVVLNDRVIFKDQTNGFENGVYDCTTEGTGGATAVFTRATDYDEASDMQAGDKFAVVKGTDNGRTEWMMTQTSAITIGTTDITFGEMAQAGALLQSQNLADVDSASTSRTNLGLGSIATQDENSVSITGGNIDGTTIGGTTPAAGTFSNVTVQGEINHDGDANNKVVFGTDTQDFQTGGASRLDISDSGVRLGGANARVADILTDNTMAAASDTNLYTGLAVKEYVDNNISTEPQKNILINGSFRISQRGNSYTSATTPANDDGNYTLDRWVLLSDGNDVIDLSQESSVVPDGSHTAVKLDVETANKKAGILNIVESSDAARIIGGTCSLSFKAQKVAGNTTVDKLRAAVIAWYGTGDQPTKDVVSTWNAEGADPTLVANWTYENTPSDLTLTDSWQTFTIENVSVDTASTKNVAVFIWIDNDDGTVGDLVYITDVKLEEGEVSTPYPVELDVQILHDCMQYYQRYEYNSGISNARFLGNAKAISTSVGIWHWVYPQRMRTDPSINFSDSGAVDITDSSGSYEASSNLQATTPLKASVQIAVTKTTANLSAGDCAALKFGSNKWLEIDAELGV